MGLFCFLQVFIYKPNSMAKKLKINEQQLSVLVQYIKEGTINQPINESELLEEGVKEWTLIGLMTLASMAGKAQTVPVETESDINHAIEASIEVQEKLADENSLEYQIFKQETKDLNAQNAEKLRQELLSIKPKDKMVMNTFITKNLNTAASRVKWQGYTIDGVKIKSDTLWKKLPQPASLDSVVELNLDGNSFNTGDSSLNSDIASEIDYIVSKIRDMGGTIDSVTIISSTDAESIRMGNEALAKERSNGVKNYILSLGVDAPIDASEIHPESGSDVVSAEEFKIANINFKKAKDALKKAKANNLNTSKYEANYESAKKILDDYRESTAQYRGVTLQIHSHMPAPAGAENMEISKVIHRYEVSLVQLKQANQPGKFKKYTSSGKVKKFKCKINLPDMESLPCEIFK